MFQLKTCRNHSNTYLIHPFIHLACNLSLGLVIHQQMRGIKVFDDELFIDWLGVVHVYNELLRRDIARD